MSEDDDLRDAMAAATVADALKDGDLDALVDLMDVLEAAGLTGKIAGFALGILWELLPDGAQQKMVATAEAEGKNNVIDFFTRKPRG